MIELIYATSNPAKVKHMNLMIYGLEIKIIGLCDLKNIEIPEINEIGKNPLENAVIKAKEYYKILNRPLFSADSGLYITGLNEDKQPGVHVRRVNGKELTDDEMIEYYSNIARESGGEIKARYRNGICLIVNDDHIHKYDGVDIGSEEFIICDLPHEIRKKGFPLDTISKKINGQYFAEIDKNKENYKMAKVFQEFFRQGLNL